MSSSTQPSEVAVWAAQSPWWGSQKAQPLPLVRPDSVTAASAGSRVTRCSVFACLGAQVIAFCTQFSVFKWLTWPLFRLHLVWVARRLLLCGLCLTARLRCHLTLWESYPLSLSPPVSGPWGLH